MNTRKKELLETYNFRYACKQFLADQKISDEDFDFILETGRLSPSSFGWEPWKFVVVQNMETRAKLFDHAWGAHKKLSTASHFVLLMARRSEHVVAGSDYLNHIATDVQKLPEDIAKMKIDFFGEFSKNDFDLTDDRKLFDWASKQTYLPFANMMTAAAHIGIDSCPIEGFNRDKVEEILKAEGITDTDNYGVSAMVAFGYRDPDGEMFPKTRRSMDQVVEWVL